MNARNGKRSVHPGEILREELETLGLSANALSKVLGVPVDRITMILNGQRGVSADTALRLARYFGTTPQLWLNLQKTWELRRTESEKGSEKQPDTSQNLFLESRTTDGDMSMSNIIIKGVSFDRNSFSDLERSSPASCIKFGPYMRFTTRNTGFSDRGTM